MSFSNQFWTQKYEIGKTGWDIGYPAPPLTNYFNQLRSKDLKILLPGCGNAYEAGYLLKKGFTNVHVLDISAHPLEKLRAVYHPDYSNHLYLHHQDFFQHKDSYDLIIEQTFFCALSPGYRDLYVEHMHRNLKPGGHPAGVLFTFPLDDKGPPFGGDMAEYRERFTPYFQIKTLEVCYNSIAPRLGKECFINFIKPF